jgi:hypothetical protein
MYESKKEQLVAAADSIELLILGTSSAMDGVDPSQFTPYAFNLAFAAQPLEYDILLTRKYLPELPKLKYVVITTIFSSFYNEGTRSFYYYHFFGIKQPQQSFWKEDMLQSFFAHDSEQMRYILAHSFMNRPRFELVKGWSSFHNTDYQSVMNDDKARLRADFFNGVQRNYKGGDRVFNDLDSFLDFLKSKNIMPVLVTMPYHENIRKYLDRAVARKNTERLTFLAEKYNIAFLDLYADTVFVTEDFHNFDHLNEDGGIKLATIVNNKIKEKQK